LYKSVSLSLSLLHNWNRTMGKRGCTHSGTEVEWQMWLGGGEGSRHCCPLPLHPPRFPKCTGLDSSVKVWDAIVTPSPLSVSRCQETMTTCDKAQRYIQQVSISHLTAGVPIFCESGRHNQDVGRRHPGAHPVLRRGPRRRQSPLCRNRPGRPPLHRRGGQGQPSSHPSHSDVYHFRDTTSRDGRSLQAVAHRIDGRWCQA